jgi:hypothetical protein
LEPGTYRYAVAFSQTGIGDTRAPNEQVIVVPSGTSTNTITIDLPPIPAGATVDAWRIYRKGPGDDEFNLLVTVNNTATPPTDYEDDGSVLADCTKHRPTVNTTNSTNSVTIDIGTEDIPLDSRVTAWRIYKATGGGIFGVNSLLVTVTETTTPQGSDLVTTYTDTGTALFRGSPLPTTVVPPQIPLLNAGDVWSSSSDELPAALAPQGVHSLNFFMPGTLTQKQYYETVLPYDIHIERVDAFFIDAPDVTDPTDIVTIRFKDDSLVDEVQCVYTDAETVEEVQTISTDATSGTFTLSFDGQGPTAALAFDSTAAQIESALEGFSNIDDVTVQGDGSTSNPWRVTFVDPGPSDVAEMTGNDAGLTGGTLTITTAIPGDDGGTFTLDFDGEVTDAIAWNAPADALATPDGTSVTEKLEANTNITDVTVTGAGTEADPWCITFVDPGDQDVVELLGDNTNLNGDVFVSTQTQGRGNQQLDLDVTTDVQNHSWVSSTTDAGEQEAEESPATGGTLVSDQFATNDAAMELDTQNEDNEWEVGILEAGDYIAKFFVSLGATATADLTVVDNQATPVTLETRTINAARSQYEPAYEVAFSSTGTETILLRVEKTDAGSDVVRADKYEYEVDLPTFYGGQTFTGEIVITGTPTDAGGDVNVTIWY